MMKEKMLNIIFIVLIIFAFVIALWGLFDKRAAGGIIIILVDTTWIIAFRVLYFFLKNACSRLSHQKVALCKISIWGGLICVLLNTAANFARNLNTSDIYMIAAYILAALSIIFAGTATWILYKAYMQK